METIVFAASPSLSLLRLLPIQKSRVSHGQDLAPDIPQIWGTVNSNLPPELGRQRGAMQHCEGVSERCLSLSLLRSGAVGGEVYHCKRSLETFAGMALPDFYVRDSRIGATKGAMQHFERVH